MSSIFVDTSGYFAFLNRRDSANARALQIMDRLVSEQETLYTSNFVIAETHAFLLNRVGHAEASRFLESAFAGSTRIIRVREADETRARAIIRRLGDKDYSYTDATSFAIMERLHIREVFTFDDHFAQYGFTVVQ